MLPPSCVIEPLLVGPSEARSRQSSASLFSRSKDEAKKNNARPSWASVKYQLKLTIQRPGILKRNIRIYAPFIYLPPPPSAVPLLLPRRSLGAQMASIVLQYRGDGCQRIETPNEWCTRSLPFLMSPNGIEKVETEKKSGIMSFLFGGTKKEEIIWHEAWSLSVPMTAGSPFPLRSSIPFIVRCRTNKPVDLNAGSPLAFTLYRRVRLLTGRKQKPIAIQQEPIADAVLRYAAESRGVFRLNGLITLPPNCVPNFNTINLSLDYYITVVRVLDGVILHKEFVNLVCPPRDRTQNCIWPLAIRFSVA